MLFTQYWLSEREVDLALKSANVILRFLVECVHARAFFLEDGFRKPLREIEVCCDAQDPRADADFLPRGVYMAILALLPPSFDLEGCLVWRRR